MTSPSPIQVADEPVGAAARRSPPLDPDDLAADEAAVSRARSGDGEAFGTIYDRHGPRLYGHVLYPGTGGDRAAAQDLLQETFLKALEALASFTWGPRGIYPWLRAIAVNALRDHWRRRDQEARGARILAALAIDVGSDLASAQEDEERREALRERVRRSLARLNARYRLSLTSRFLEGAGPVESAQRLGVRRATFDVILHRACKAFRHVFESLREEP